jgi:hypothetical protein
MRPLREAHSRLRETWRFVRLRAHGVNKVNKTKKDRRRTNRRSRRSDNFANRRLSASPALLVAAWLEGDR